MGDYSSKAVGRPEGRRDKGYRRRVAAWGGILILCGLWMLGLGAPVCAQEGAVAVLPFQIFAPAPQPHLAEGLQQMVITRLTEKGLPTIAADVVNRTALSPAQERSEAFLRRLGADLKARWVVAGNLTQIGERYSLDFTTLDMREAQGPFFTFLTVDNLEAVPESVAQGANSVFNLIAGTPQIDQVRIAGNQRIEADAILAVVTTQKGDALDYDTIDNDLRSIFKMGFFRDVRVQTEDGPAGKIVIFNVTEKPSIGEIVFEGNKKIKKDDLEKETGIRLYTILDANAVNQSVQRLTEFYRGKGYYSVDIRQHTETLPNNEVKLVYEIAEGGKVYITDISFSGNKAFSDGELQDVMETSEKGFLSWITSSGRLDEKKLELDVLKLTAFYHNQGYIKARVGEPQVTFDKDQGLQIKIEIEEGEPYGVGRVRVEGDLIEPEEMLLEQTQIGRETVFNREMLREDVLALTSRYVDDGYAYAEVTPRTAIDDEKRLVEVTYVVSKGEKVRFERINIKGNTQTRDKVIRRELRVYEGDEFSGYGLRRSTENLHRLGFFEDVTVETRKGSEEDQMVLDIGVKEKPTGSFALGAGYSARDSVFFTFQIAQENFLGRGQRLSAAGMVGGSGNEFDIDFYEPYFLDRPIGASVRGYRWTYDYDDYSRKSTGGEMGARFPVGLGDYTRVWVTYGYDHADISDVADNASWEIKEMEGTNVTSSIETGIKRDSRDTPFFTHKGSVNDFTFEYAGGVLKGDQYFNRYEARSAWFFPLPWRTVFFSQGRGGYLKQRDGGELFSYEKYRLGGINTVRGYDYASISPKGASGDRIGGEKMMVFNFEYQFPFVEEQGVVGVVFFDAGNVFTSDQSYTFSGIKRSVGAGIRWFSPMGPIRLEYGRALDAEDDESSGRTEFSIGIPFF